MAAVRLFIDSVPQGAEIVRLSDGTVLGKTPWSREQPAAEGTEEILLRVPGYAEQRLSVALAENHEHRVTLPRKRPAPVKALRPKDRQSDPIPIMD